MQSDERKVNIIDITIDTIDEIIDPCNVCTYWEDPKSFEKGSEEGALIKKRWFIEVLGRWGCCGKLLYINDKPIGYSQYAPSRFFPQLENYAIKPSDDAVFISCLFIKESYRNKNLGKKLLTAIINDLKDRKIKAIETIARRGSSNNPSGPLEFYLKNEFKIIKEHEEFPLLRLEL